MNYGYYPHGKDWYVKFSLPNREGLVRAWIIMHNGETINYAKNLRMTLEEASIKADQYMKTVDLENT